MGAKQPPGEGCFREKAMKLNVPNKKKVMVKSFLSQDIDRWIDLAELYADP